jgi:DNA-directed RNA polymerase specialized sigma24 family protein
VRPESEESLRALVTAYETIENPILKEAIHLTVFRDLSVGDAAAAAGVTYKSMARRRERGLKLIKERYEDTCHRGSASTRRASEVPEVHTGHAGLVEA